MVRPAGFGHLTLVSSFLSADSLTNAAATPDAFNLPPGNLKAIFDSFYNHEVADLYEIINFMVHPAGFEPATPCSEDKCSNPLSYRCIETSVSLL